MPLARPAELGQQILVRSAADRGQPAAMIVEVRAQIVAAEASEDVEDVLDPPVGGLTPHLTGNDRVRFREADEALEDGWAAVPMPGQGDLAVVIHEVIHLRAVLQPQRDEEAA